MRNATVAALEIHTLQVAAYLELLTSHAAPKRGTMCQRSRY
ncbi:hypothetical protein X772_30245 [Mesorhizobium sp. LSJC280B00]|nr:hypothetical protein X772_30245 [Mesorhizobium sp. LSJC280B00]